MSLIALFIILLVFIWSGIKWDEDTDVLAYGFRVVE